MKPGVVEQAKVDALFVELKLCNSTSYRNYWVTTKSWCHKQAASNDQSDCFISATPGLKITTSVHTPYADNIKKIWPFHKGNETLWRKLKICSNCWVHLVKMVVRLKYAVQYASILAFCLKFLISCTLFWSPLSIFCRSLLLSKEF